MLLKQGSYNYQYLTVPPGARRGYTATIEGDKYQSALEAAVFVSRFEDERRVVGEYSCSAAHAQRMGKRYVDVHYSLKIPNEQIQLKLSGNYLLKVYPESEPDSCRVRMRSLNTPVKVSAAAATMATAVAAIAKAVLREAIPPGSCLWNTDTGWLSRNAGSPETPDRHSAATDAEP